MIETNFKMNQLTYEALLEVYEFMNDGRISIAKERLEEILGIDIKEVA